MSKNNTLSLTKTCVLCLGVFLFFLCLQVMSLIVVSVVFFDEMTQDVSAIATGLQHGQVVALSTIITAIIMIIVCGYSVWYATNKNCQRFCQVLGLKSFGVGLLIKSVVCLCLLMVLEYQVVHYYQLSPMDFVDELIATTDFWLLLVVIVVVAPIYEEIIFRGAILGLIKYSLDTKYTNQIYSVLWASLISSALFTVAHLHYSAMILGLLFLMSMSWAYFRCVSGSLYLTIVLHLINNALAMAYYVLDGL